MDATSTKRLSDAVWDQEHLRIGSNTDAGPEIVDSKWVMESHPHQYKDLFLF